MHYMEERLQQFYNKLSLEGKMDKYLKKYSGYIILNHRKIKAGDYISVTFNPDVVGRRIDKVIEMKLTDVNKSIFYLYGVGESMIEIKRIKRKYLEYHDKTKCNCNR